MPVKAGANSSVFLCLADGSFPIPGVRIPYYADLVTPLRRKIRNAGRFAALLRAIMAATSVINYLSNA
jgi:hypothetical protein